MTGRIRRARGGAAQGSTWVSGGVATPANNTLEIQADESMEMETAPVEEGVKKIVPAWLKVGPDGKPIKKKPNPAKRNAMFRKNLQPKTAIMCLNELVTGLKYEVETLASVGNFAASVEVHGVVYRGYGSSKMLAKQAAAEAALVSFVKPPPPKAAPGEEEPVDDTPWKTIASFAMYKLFAEWSEGNAGRQPPKGPMNQGMGQMPGDLRNYLTEMQTQQFTPGAQSNFGQNMKKAKAAKSNATSKTVQPAKGLSDEAKATQHPVMVVNQLNPGIQYTPEESVDANNARVWSITATVEDVAYTGSGPNQKKAKLACAKTVLFELYGITSQYEGAN